MNMMTSNTTTMSFSEVVRARRAIRQFLPTPVDPRVLQEVFEEAQLAPSNCNTQVWNVHVASGDALQRLSRRMLEAHEAGAVRMDFTFEPAAFGGRYGERLKEQGKHYYESLGVKRDDQAGRAEAVAKNFRFFDAPHCAFLFMPTVGDNVRAAADVGLYAQTLMLALTARGIGSIPLTSPAMYTDVIRETLGVSEDLKFLHAVAFGYADTNAPSYATRLGRDPIEKNVIFHS